MSYFLVEEHMHNIPINIKIHPIISIFCIFIGFFSYKLTKTLSKIVNINDVDKIPVKTPKFTGFLR